MNKQLCGFILSLAAASVCAQNTIVTTHTVFPLLVTNEQQVVVLPNTNVISIPAGFAVRVSSFTPRTWSGPWTFANVHVEKDGLRWQANQGELLQGPCIVNLVTAKSSDPSQTGTNPANLTLERWRTLKVLPAR